MFNLKSFTKQCLRVWKLLKKPSKTEFTTIAKVSAIGLALIGVIGFAISLLMEFLGLV
ncbi:protein translocase SEC61 complex subunit gamma [archaeon]|jgi:protein transport protein SEC61 subunit gamma and related proteins|nr:protein translocase SEC61 complex subunit gamma [archaeon]MBT4242174.1 protein translocase SEC61 complex subunit gamma [archaeon]MBT4417862.1 protein translocase SEC61 complex subunit gamma [archaeon]